MSKLRRKHNIDYYSLPAFLFRENKNLNRASSSAKLLYALLLDRLAYSCSKNFRERGRVFVYFTIQEVCKKLHIGKDQATQVFSELERLNLINRKKQKHIRTACKIFFVGKTWEKYLKLPTFLLDDEKYSCLSSSAKLLYTLLLDRSELSKKNHFFEDGQVFVYFTVKEAREMLCISAKTVYRIFSELEKLGLIRKKRQGRKNMKIFLLPVFDWTKSDATKTEEYSIKKKKYYFSSFSYSKTRSSDTVKKIGACNATYNHFFFLPAQRRSLSPRCNSPPDFISAAKLNS